MIDGEQISQYDLVEVIQVPDRYKGVIEIGDIGVVVEKYDNENVEVECLQPGGSYKWLEPLHIKYLRLRSKDPYSPWVERSLTEKPILQTSLIWGTGIGGSSGALIGAGLGAITGSLSGVLIGLVIGLLLGALTGILTAALTVKTAGTTGGVGVGYYTGMLFGGVLGVALGMLVPTSWRVGAHTEGLPVLDALAQGRFETAMLSGFLFSTLATIVGIWIGGRNFVPRNLKERYRP